MRYLLITLSFLLLPCVLAAQLSGTAYTENLLPAKYSLLLINTTPQQRMILEDGTYNITLPKGSYHLDITSYEHSTKSEDSLNITIQDGSQYTYDFILFPVANNITENIPQVDDITPAQGNAVSIGWVPAVLLLILLTAFVIVLSRRRWWQVEKAADKNSEQPEEKMAEKPVAADLEEILKFIKAEGGRTTQKELRKHVPCSEAKMSMMLTELEAKGKIEKIKKGRGNLIILK